MENTVVSLSNELAKLVERFQPDVVAVHARPHYPSSGVLWRPDIIVTADHTVRREEDIQVTLSDGRTVSAALVGRDSRTDVTVLKVKGLGSPTTSAARAGVSDPARAGELALVLGRSPDSGPNASLGIISAVSGPWRTWRGGRLDSYIRLDATLFPNSSGGMVVDCRGQILGIATSGLSRIAGLAIPASSVNRVVDGLLEKGYLPRGYFGIGVQPVVIPEALREKLSVPGQNGVIVVSVEPGGPAERAGVLLGDILVGLDDASLEGIEDLRSFSDSGVIGKLVKARIIRAGAIAEVGITVGERPGR
ncbi:MAG TPA: trypsin-like peptidase domain-containing protein [Terriglobia bacterium]|nr:trypsin-like peptidase domain-containing protein [Terriglobia bacterium]